MAAHEFVLWKRMEKERERRSRFRVTGIAVIMIAWSLKKNKKN